MPISISLFVCALSPDAHADICAPDMAAGENCRINVKDILPSQGVVGMKEVDLHRREIHKLLGHKKRLEKYLKKYRAKTVIGPDGQFHLIDGHHHAYSAEKEGLSEIYVSIEADYSKLSMSQFWKKLEEKDWVYLKNAQGVKIDPSALPRHLSGLEDDPYRSLAWAVEKSKAVKDKNIPFAEFKWADHFRDKIPLREVKSDFDGSVKRAIALALDPEAKGLPGYIKLKPKKQARAEAECWVNYRDLISQ